MSDLRETAFSWTIHNFDVAPCLPGERLESPGFSLDVMKNSKFSLLLYPRGTKDRNYVALYVKRLCDDEAEDLFLRYELCLVDASGKCTNTQSSSTAFRKNVLKGCSRFYERHLLMGALRRILLPDNKLTVRCRLSPQEDEDGCLYRPSDCEVLSEDFAQLLDNGIHSDLAIEVQGRVFRVHRAILEARCPGLVSRLVQTDKPDRMVLPSTEASILQEVLHYIYTGIFKDIGKQEDVFAAANRFGIASLKALLYPYPDTSSAETVIESLRLSFRWTIPHFKSFPQSNKEVSYTLVADDMPENSWMKVVLFAEECDGGKKSTFLKFQKLRNYHSGALHFKVQASDKNNELVLLKESEDVFERGKIVIPFDVGRKSVEMSTRRDLVLHFDIRASIAGRRSSVQEINFSQTRSHDDLINWKGLQKDMLNFCKSMTTGDVTLNVGASKLSAHKAVLCSRSEVFSKMFEHDSLESQTNSVSIEDVDEETMTSVLTHMYCGATDDSTHVLQAIKTYSAADKYQLLLLKEKCCQYLKSNINAENVGDVLLVSDAHSDEDLKECVRNFITGNPSEVFHSVRGLKVLEDRVDLYQDILNVLLRRCSLQNKTPVSRPST